MINGSKNLALPIQTNLHYSPPRTRRNTKY